MAIQQLEPGRYYIRCVYINSEGETYPYLTIETLTENWNYLEVKRFILRQIELYGGTNPGDVTFKRVLE